MEEEGNKLKGEEAFRKTRVPPWTEQITVRSVVTSFVLSVVFIFIVCKLNFTTGIIPSFNVAAGLLGFAVIKAYTTLLNNCGLLKQPFTRQENTTISLGWMFGFLFFVSFVGLFPIVPLRKVMILKYKLSYPSGTATALLINSLHTKRSKASKWFFTAGDDCGFITFPTFGLQAYSKRFYFDFSSTYVGVGMICPYLINASLLLGAIFSWGILWPLIEHKKGIWYSADLPSGSLSGIQGYRVFIAIAMILGDVLYHWIIMLIRVAYSLTTQYLKKRGSSTVDPEDADQNSSEDFDAQRCTEYFLKDEIPSWVAIIGYSVLAVISIITVSRIFPQQKWYHVLITYLIAPILAFCNAYGCGLTDGSSASNYGKLAIIIFSSWVGLEHGGIIAGLASCGVMMGIVSTASDLMQDFKTGYLTLGSPRSMFVSQVLGTATAIIFFFLAVCINIVRDLLERYETKYRLHRFVPNPMALTIPFYLGGYFSIDMCIGSLILFLWEKKKKQKAKDYGPALASGLICGDSLWSVPAAILSLAGPNPPICMKFLSRAMNKKVDTFLSGGH
ncbi:putative metal-nicotianamine transporter YSL7 [Glycine soja]|uniref:Putative metal-nicotianamine transporter YSL7 n=1 Tax=Glycine soja TaxID=3848 RepID=A0A445J7B6_GLYSO|nr:putative metal-nicotianamine transporter YSL7 [Glycine soja]